MARGGLPLGTRHPTLGLPRSRLLDETGSVSTVVALSLAGLLALGGFAVEVANIYARKVHDQRVADLIALSAAVSHHANQSSDGILSTAVALAAQHDITPDELTVLLSEPAADGSRTVQVVINRGVELLMSRLFSGDPGLNVVSIDTEAVASIGGGKPTCLLALSRSHDHSFLATGGASISMSSCGLSANSSVLASGGASISSSSVRSVGTISTEGGAKIVTAPDPDNIVENVSSPFVDPLADNALLDAALGLVGQYTRPATAPGPVTPAAEDWLLTWSPSANVKPFRTSQWGSDWLIPPGNYSIGRLELAGGMSVTFQGPSSITIAEGIENGGRQMTFEGGNIRINGGIEAGPGISFGSGTIEMGRGIYNLSGETSFHNGSVSMKGTLKVARGASVSMGNGAHIFGSVVVAGGGRLSIGSGSLDIRESLSISGGGSQVDIGDGSYAIGHNRSGEAILVSGGSQLQFGDGQFSANGSVTTSGGSTLIFGQSNGHYINGDLLAAGNVAFGRGNYFVNGDFVNATGGRMAGKGVIFLLSGALGMAGGTQVELSAPGSVEDDAFNSIVIATRSSSPTILAGGASNTFKGVMYAPNSDVVVRGGAAARGPNDCFMLIANTMSYLEGGYSSGVRCAALDGPNGNQPILLIR